MKKILSSLLSAILFFLFANTESSAQQYKLRQVNSMMGMKTESTIYVKGMRKRTEGGGMMGMTNPTTIQQCDLQRTIKINDKKKLYYIEPFSNEPEEIIDEDQKPPPPSKNKPVTPVTTTSPKKGGIIYMYYNITDTGERKKMYGFTARHVWTTQKMKPSADACMMKDSMIIKTDGWYIDLPEFNCPIKYRPDNSMMRQRQPAQPDCMDKFISKRSGKGKLGFVLSETRTMIMGGQAQTSQFETTIETLEFSTAKLDSMLFEIPPGYTETKNEDDLQDKFSMADMMKNAENMNMNDAQQIINGLNNNGEKRPGVIRIGVYEPKNDGQLQAGDLQRYLAGILIGDKVEAIPVASEEEAKSKSCDYSLTTDFTRIKSASKVGGLLKAIKNSDPNATSSYNMTTDITLTKLADHSITLQQRIDGKYDGKVDDAAKRVAEEESRLVLKALK